MKKYLKFQILGSFIVALIFLVIASYVFIKDSKEVSYKFFTVFSLLLISGIAHLMIYKGKFWNKNY